jgi:hypothetical protein
MNMLVRSLVLVFSLVAGCDVPRSVVAPETRPAPPPVRPLAPVVVEGGGDGAAPVRDAASTEGDAGVAGDADAVGRTEGGQEVAAARVFRGRAEDEWLREMASRPVVRMISRHMSTAVVYRLDLGDGIEVGFKPERPGQTYWWRREIVSYHFARLLGIEGRVPPVVGRRVAASMFGRFARRDALVVDAEGMVPGSASVWMPSLHGEEIHIGEGRQEWGRWLRPGAHIPAEHRERARQIAVLLVFDHLMGNFDRWNCCNIPIDEHDQLVYRDNDAGWQPRILDHVGSPSHIRRLPRSLYEALARVTGDALRAAFERDPMASVGFVVPEAMPAYDRRRQKLLVHLRRIIARHGEDAVLAWP